MVKKRALTLLEILLATFLIAVALLALVGVHLEGLRLTRQGREFTRATDLAGALLESVQDLGYDQIPPDGLFDGAKGDPAVAGFPPSPYPGVTLDSQHFDLKVVAKSRDVHLKSVHVEVSWGGKHKVVLERLFSS